MGIFQTIFYHFSITYSVTVECDMFIFEFLLIKSYSRNCCGGYWIVK